MNMKFLLNIVNEFTHIFIACRDVHNIMRVLFYNLIIYKGFIIMLTYVICGTEKFSPPTRVPPNS